MRSARRLMLVKICIKFHEGILNGFWVTEQTRPYRKIYYFQFQRVITPKIRNPESRFLRSAYCLMLFYIGVKFHENILNGFWVTEWTRFCDRDFFFCDRWPGQKQCVSQPYRGRHKKVYVKVSLTLPQNRRNNSLFKKVHTFLGHPIYIYIYMHRNIY